MSERYPGLLVGMRLVIRAFCSLIRTATKKDKQRYRECKYVQKRYQAADIERGRAKRAIPEQYLLEKVQKQMKGSFRDGDDVASLRNC